MQILARFTMAQKLGGFAAMLVFLIGLVGGIGLLSMAKMVTEIVAIAEEDLPLAGRAETITAHQLEQMIHFERALRLGEEMHLLESDSAAAHFESEIEYFTKLSHQVSGEIHEAVVLIEAILAKPHDAETTAEWVKIRDGFAHAEGAHADFETHALQVFEALRAGNLEETATLALEVEHEGDKLDEELAGLSHELIRFTLQAAVRAEHNEIAAQRLIAATLGVALLLAIVLSWILSRAITRSLAEVVTALGALAEEDTSVEVTPRGRDEVSVLAKAYGKLREQVLEGQRLRRQRREMEERSQEERKALMQSLANRFETDVAGVVTSVVGSSEQLTATADSMTRVSQQTAERATSVAAATEQTSNNMQTVAAAGEEMGKSIEEIVQLVGRSTTMASGAVREVDTANQQVRGLADAADRIGQVITLISDIAEQTNLLALNATIEAARAGEAGKGFAVVASEVKNLANQTAKAADEVTSHIERVQSETSDAVQAIDRIGQSIQQIEESATAVSAAVEEQSAATNEIVRNVHEASAGTQTVAGNVDGVTEAARETEGAAGEMRGAAGELSQRSRELQNKVEAFLTEVRTA